jgi:hypothetical protein
MPLSIGEEGSLAWQRLARTNHHPRDDHIQFNEEEHSYAINGSKAGWVSCTQFKGQFFGHFDADAVIKKMMSGANWVKSPYYGKTAEEIKAGWSASGEEASTAGTRMHLDIEHFYNSSELSVESMKRDDDWTPNASPEWDQFMAYQARHGSKMTPYRTEWLVWMEEIKLAGSIDMLYKKDDGTFAIYDWKRSKKIETENRYQSGLGPLTHLPDANYWTYSLQLNIYRMILKLKYNMDVTDLALVILHPNQTNWRVIKINIMEDEVNAMFDARRRALKVKDNDGSNPVVVFEGVHHVETDSAAPAGWAGLD